MDAWREWLVWGALLIRRGWGLGVRGFVGGGSTALYFTPGVHPPGLGRFFEWAVGGGLGWIGELYDDVALFAQLIQVGA